MSMSMSKSHSITKRKCVYSDNNMKKSTIQKTNNLLEYVLEVLKFTLWEYFVGTDGASNSSIDLQNFIISGKKVYDQLHRMFIESGSFGLEECLAMSSEKKSLVHRIRMRDKSCWKFSKTLNLELLEFPNIQQLDVCANGLYERVNGSSFEDFIKHLPSTLKCVKLPAQFVSMIGPNELPQNLLKLHTGWKFNQLLEPGVLPSSLVKLEFGDWYSQSLILGSLPPNLEELVFNDAYNMMLTSDVLPPKLKLLVFGEKFNQPLGHCPDNNGKQILPSSLKILKLGKHFNNQIILPQNLIELSFGNFNQLLTTLPQNLRSLDLGAYDHPLCDLPQTLMYLRINSRYSHSLERSIPNLKKLESLDIDMVKETSQRLVKIEQSMFPPSLRKFRYNDPMFDQNLTNRLPRELAELTLSIEYRKTDTLLLSTDDNNNSLPITLQKLIFVAPELENQFMSNNPSSTQICRAQGIDFGQYSMHCIKQSYIWRFEANLDDLKMQWTKTMLLKNPW